MAKIRLTKNELKKQKDSLKMYKRYLPTLMLKKQQLQGEIRITDTRLSELQIAIKKLDETFKKWIAVFGETGVFTKNILKVINIKTGSGNIAGVPIPVFEGANFEIAKYDLIKTPLWLDIAVECMKKALLLELEVKIVEEQKKRLDKELRTTTQRVNLFEKIKIPETRNVIKKIQVYLGDQQTASVVRGKIAKSAFEKAAK
ncbi:MAG: V-type ATP synthase subunit D [Treponema sp.]|nr:V-type ATP synthase subunit D [Treponema sp.]